MFYVICEYLREKTHLINLLKQGVDITGASKVFQAHEGRFSVRVQLQVPSQIHGWNRNFARVIRVPVNATERRERTDGLGGREMIEDGERTPARRDRLALARAGNKGRDAVHHILTIVDALVEEQCYVRLQLRIFVI